ncbi:hypothetical protein VSR01_34640 [Actinacidiphila sp. DG2A-62]|uniref:hypothetical protein n=1 Tax=Actinacidiphila sp. DG2A-62 TaxID=3108821 RepID=UPI002DBCF7E1|nr:hypothetical protein [Actinacidiphila sp. DG2A-62]MEC3998354.1 hypothetical protein [Actinacidiphila sp. DG2A-62]
MPSTRPHWAPVDTCQSSVAPSGPWTSPTPLAAANADGRPEAPPRCRDRARTEETESQAPGPPPVGEPVSSPMTRSLPETASWVTKPGSSSLYAVAPVRPSSTVTKVPKCWSEPGTVNGQPQLPQLAAPRLTPTVSATATSGAPSPVRSPIAYGWVLPMAYEEAVVT